MEQLAGTSQPHRRKHGSEGGGIVRFRAESGFRKWLHRFEALSVRLHDAWLLLSLACTRERYPQAPPRGACTRSGPFQAGGYRLSVSSVGQFGHPPAAVPDRFLLNTQGSRL
eukprot:1856144-Pleurochrysis_carterae.AAC.2